MCLNKHFTEQSEETVFECVPGSVQVVSGSINSEDETKKKKNQITGGGRTSMSRVPVFSVVIGQFAVAPIRPLVSDRQVRAYIF